MNEDENTFIMDAGYYRIFGGPVTAEGKTASGGEILFVSHEVTATVPKCAKVVVFREPDKITYRQ